MIVAPHTWATRDPLAVDCFISRRCGELGLNRGALAQRLGFKNPTKALRRLDDLCDGDLARTEAVIRALPTALQVPAEVIADAIEETRVQLEKAEKARAAEAEAAWRAAFKPHAVILTERDRPSPLFMAACIGVDRLLRVDFDLAAPPSSFVGQALDGLREKLQRWGGIEKREITCFGAPIGVIVNYSPDRGVQYDLNGNAVDLLPHAHRLGNAEFFINCRGIPPRLLQISDPWMSS